MQNLPRRTRGRVIAPLLLLFTLVLSLAASAHAQEQTQNSQDKNVTAKQLSKGVGVVYDHPPNVPVFNRIASPKEMDQWILEHHAKPIHERFGPYLGNLFLGYNGERDPRLWKLIIDAIRERMNHSPLEGSRSTLRGLSAGELAQLKMDWIRTAEPSQQKKTTLLGFLRQIESRLPSPPIPPKLDAVVQRLVTKERVLEFTEVQSVEDLRDWIEKSVIIPLTEKHRALLKLTFINYTGPDHANFRITMIGIVANTVRAILDPAPQGNQPLGSNLGNLRQKLVEAQPRLKKYLDVLINEFPPKAASALHAILNGDPIEEILDRKLSDDEIDRAKKLGFEFARGNGKKRPFDAEKFINGLSEKFQKFSLLPTNFGYPETPLETGAQGTLFGAALEQALLELRRTAGLDSHELTPIEHQLQYETALGWLRHDLWVAAIEANTLLTEPARKATEGTLRSRIINFTDAIDSFGEPLIMLDGPPLTIAGYRMREKHPGQHPTFSEMFKSTFSQKNSPETWSQRALSGSALAYLRFLRDTASLSDHLATTSEDRRWVRDELRISERAMILKMVQGPFTEVSKQILQATDTDLHSQLKSFENLARLSDAPTENRAPLENALITLLKTAKDAMDRFRISSSTDIRGLAALFEVPVSEEGEGKTALKFLHAILSDPHTSDTITILDKPKKIDRRIREALEEPQHTIVSNEPKPENINPQPLPLALPKNQVEKARLHLKELGISLGPFQIAFGDVRPGSFSEDLALRMTPEAVKGFHIFSADSYVGSNLGISPILFRPLTEVAGLTIRILEALGNAEEAARADLYLNILEWIPEGKAVQTPPPKVLLEQLTELEATRPAPSEQPEVKAPPAPVEHVEPNPEIETPAIPTEMTDDQVQKWIRGRFAENKTWKHICAKSNYIRDRLATWFGEPLHEQNGAAFSKKWPQYQGANDPRLLAFIAHELLPLINTVDKETFHQNLDTPLFAQIRHDRRGWTTNQTIAETRKVWRDLLKEIINAGMVHEHRIAKGANGGKTNGVEKKKLIPRFEPVTAFATFEKSNEPQSSQDPLISQEISISEIRQILSENFFLGRQIQFEIVDGTRSDPMESQIASKDGPMALTVFEAGSWRSWMLLPNQRRVSAFSFWHELFHVAQLITVQVDAGAFSSTEEASQWLWSMMNRGGEAGEPWAIEPKKGCEDYADRYGFAVLKNRLTHTQAFALLREIRQAGNMFPLDVVSAIRSRKPAQMEPARAAANLARAYLATTGTTEMTSSDQPLRSAPTDFSTIVEDFLADIRTAPIQAVKPATPTLSQTIDAIPVHKPIPQPAPWEPAFYIHYGNFVSVIGLFDVTDLLLRYQHGDITADQFLPLLGQRLGSPEAVGAYFGFMKVQGFTDSMITKAVGELKASGQVDLLAKTVLRQALSMGITMSVMEVASRSLAQVSNDLEAYDGISAADLSRIPNSLAKAFRGVEGLKLALNTMGWVVGGTLATFIPGIGQTWQAQLAGGKAFSMILEMAANPIAATAATMTKDGAKDLFTQKILGQLANLAEVHVALQILADSFDAVRDPIKQRIRRIETEMAWLAEGKLSSRLTRQENRLEKATASLVNERQKAQVDWEKSVDEELMHLASTLPGGRILLEGLSQDAAKAFAADEDLTEESFEALAPKARNTRLAETYRAKGIPASSSSLYSSVALHSQRLLSGTYILRNALQQVQTTGKQNALAAIAAARNKRSISFVRDFDLRSTKLIALKTERNMEIGKYEIDPKVKTRGEMMWHLWACETMVQAARERATWRSRGIVLQSAAADQLSIGGRKPEPHQLSKDELQKQWEGCRAEAVKLGARSQRVQTLNEEIVNLDEEIKRDIVSSAAFVPRKPAPTIFSQGIDLDWFSDEPATK